MYPRIISRHSSPLGPSKTPPRMLASSFCLAKAANSSRSLRKRRHRFPRRSVFSSGVTNSRVRRKSRKLGGPKKKKLPKKQYVDAQVAGVHIFRRDGTMKRCTLDRYQRNLSGREVRAAKFSPTFPAPRFFPPCERVARRRAFRNLPPSSTRFSPNCIPSTPRVDAFLSKSYSELSSSSRRDSGLKRRENDEATGKEAD